MDVVVVRSQSDKIRRIINTAIKNKPANNPEQYDRYECTVYYKSSADLLPLNDKVMDSIRQRRKAIDSLKKREEKQRDTTVPSFNVFAGNNHLIFTETYSKRSYKRPQQVQELVIASRFSGLKETYFTNIITDVLPFHIYTDYIQLSGIDFINPVAKGWQQRYRFFIEDELTMDADTVFILSFAPKEGTVFNGLRGTVYINTRGYALSHFTAVNADTANDRQIKFEQIYSYVHNKWFPKELNYELSMRRAPAAYMQIKMNGHAVVDSVSFNAVPTLKFDKAHPVKLGDSVDLYTEKQWQQFRKDTLASKEESTYRVMDSLVAEHHIDKFVEFTGKAYLGRFPLGKFDLDINRLIARNSYEKTRLGAGLYTNEKISKYYSLGGWAGYGFHDKVWKYGGSLTVYPDGKKENWFSFSYQNNYRNAGDVLIHPDLDKKGFRNWLLSQVDQFEEYAVTSNLKKGYWEIKADASRLNLHSLYDNKFIVAGKQINTFNTYEGSIGLRYSYGEKRTPFFDTYIPEETKYPIAYLRLSAGTIRSGTYTADYGRAVAAITFEKHLNRWGFDHYKLEGGLIHSFNGQPLSRSFLLAGNGYNIDRFHYYAQGVFVTMHPYDFYSDRYISFFYKHDFDRYFWDFKYSKPFLSVAHNMIFGDLNTANRSANENIGYLNKSYHESGILLNQLGKINFHFANLYLNAGVFYHWNNKLSFGNSKYVLGFSAGF
jgi:hypothetical protein